MDRRVGPELMAVSNLVRRIMDHEVYTLTKEEHLTGANIQLLGYLLDNKDNEVYQKDMEKAFSLRASTISSNLRLMQKKELITREYSKIDTRLKRVMITQKAVDLLSKMKLRANDLDQRFDSVLTQEEQKQLLVYLEKMKSALE